MRYFDEMNLVEGFDNGECIPLEAEHCRAVYVKAINILLARQVSDWRLIAYNRTENNRCIVMRVPKDFVDGTFDEMDGRDGFAQTPAIRDAWELTEPDEAFHNAIAIARKLHLDEAVHVQVFVDYKHVSDKLFSAERLIPC